jgi:hypothetical protein
MIEFTELLLEVLTNTTKSFFKDYDIFYELDAKDKRKTLIPFLEKAVGPGVSQKELSDSVISRLNTYSFLTKIDDVYVYLYFKLSQIRFISKNFFLTCYILNRSSGNKIIATNQISPFAHEMYLCWRSYYQIILDKADRINRQNNVAAKLLTFFNISHANAVKAGPNGHATLCPFFHYIAHHHCTNTGPGPKLQGFLGITHTPCPHPLWEVVAGMCHIICHAYQVKSLNNFLILVGARIH